MAALGLSQNLSLRQTMSRAQIMSMRLLAMGARDLDEEVEKALAENPALEAAGGAKKISSWRPPYDGTRVGTASAAGIEKAREKQEAYENAEAEGETLQEHLLFQLDVAKLSSEEKALGEKLIRNLDSNGFNVLAPATLLDKPRGAQNEAALRKVMDAIQRMDPEGTCCDNMEKSLLAQARIKGDAPPLALLILDGHLDALYSTSSVPDIPRIQKKLKSIGADATEGEVARAIEFISRLNPRPAQGFARGPTPYARPDIVVEKAGAGDGANGGEMEEIVQTGGGQAFRVRMAQGALPELRLSERIAREGREKFGRQIDDARALIAAIEYRRSTAVRATAAIVRRQIGFFMSEGKSALEPLTQSSVAAALGASESTVSRVANGKFIQSPWGRLYPVKYFFAGRSEKIKEEMRKIISEARENSLPMSDREMAEELSRRGARVSRRAVAKYRADMGEPSSYERNGSMKSPRNFLG